MSKKHDKRKNAPGLDPTRANPGAASGLEDFTLVNPAKPARALGDMLLGDTAGSSLSAIPFIKDLQRKEPAPRLAFNGPVKIRTAQPASRLQPLQHVVRPFAESWLERLKEWNRVLEHFERIASKQQSDFRSTINQTNNYEALLHLIHKDDTVSLLALEQLRTSSQNRVALVETIVAAILRQSLLGTTEWQDIFQSAGRLGDRGWFVLKALAAHHKYQLFYEDGQPVSPLAFGKQVSSQIKIGEGGTKPLAELDEEMETARQFVNICQSLLPRILPHVDKSHRQVDPVPDLKVVREFDAAVQDFTAKARKHSSLLGEDQPELDKEQRKARAARGASLDANEAVYRPAIIEAVELAREDWASALSAWQKKPGEQETRAAIEQLRFTIHSVICTSYQVSGGEKLISGDPETVVEAGDVSAAAEEMENSPATRASNLQHLMKEAYAAYSAAHLWEQSKAAPADVLVTLEAMQVATNLYDPLYEPGKLEPIANHPQEQRPVLALDGVLSEVTDVLSRQPNDGLVK
jgi:hypothetical protein